MVHREKEKTKEGVIKHEEANEHEEEVVESIEEEVKRGDGRE